MAKTKLLLWNQALELVGAPGELQAENENSREGQLCRTFYETTLESVQELVSWPSSIRTVLLGSTSAPLRAEASQGDWTPAQPSPGFNYSYFLPEDFLRAWFVTHGAFYSLEFFDGKRTIEISLKGVTLEYAALTGLVDRDIALWPAIQFEATVLALAERIALPLEGSQELQQDLALRANYTLRQAQAAVLNENPQNFDFEAPWIAVRRSPNFVVQAQPKGISLRGLPRDKSVPWRAFPREY